MHSDKRYIDFSACKCITQCLLNEPSKHQIPMVYLTTSYSRAIKRYSLVITKCGKHISLVVSPCISKTFLSS